jgi:hypothetical protein
MNAASNKLKVRLSTGESIGIQVVHLLAPPVSKENPSGLSQDYCLISEDGGAEPFLFRIVARSPLTIEQLDINSPQGRSHWQQVDTYLKTTE